MLFLMFGELAGREPSYPVPCTAAREVSCASCSRLLHLAWQMLQSAWRACRPQGPRPPCRPKSSSDSDPAPRGSQTAKRSSRSSTVWMQRSSQMDRWRAKSNLTCGALRMHSGSCVASPLRYLLSAHPLQLPVAAHEGTQGTLPLRILACPACPTALCPASQARASSTDVQIANRAMLVEHGCRAF